MLAALVIKQAIDLIMSDFVLPTIAIVFHVLTNFMKLLIVVVEPPSIYIKLSL